MLLQIICLQLYDPDDSFLLLGKLMDKELISWIILLPQTASRAIGENL